MQYKNNNRLTAKVLIAGAAIAILSYLFYPGAGQLGVMLNGDAVAEPLVRFAAVPTFLLVMIIIGILMVLLFLGVGVFMLLCAIFVALTGFFIMTPSFWSVLVIIVLVMATMIVGSGNKG